MRNFTLKYCFFLALGSMTLLNTSCQNSAQLPHLSDQRSDSLEKFYDSDLKHANGYYAYAKATSKDTTIHVEKEVTNAYYPWKVNLNKQMVDSFLVDLQKNLKADSVYKSAFGEFASIEAKFIPYDKNYVMSHLLKCTLAGYDLTNNKGEKITIKETAVSINSNSGSISFSPAKWDLQNQKIKGNVTLEITIPYKIYEIDLKAADARKTFPFSDTKIDILEFKNNVLHYKIQDEKNYTTDVMVDNCMGGKSFLSFPAYFYDKIRKKPNLSYQEFLRDSAYFELGKHWKKVPRDIHIVYFDSCDPNLIYLYGYRKTDVLTRRITIPIDVKIL